MGLIVLGFLYCPGARHGLSGFGPVGLLDTDADGQFRVGRMYYVGIGTEPIHERAIYYWDLSCANGNLSARIVTVRVLGFLLHVCLFACLLY